ncbi:MAG TPA: hypothetical protein VK203_06195 [Nostocaceae cyanobacterium]|nr:hypothetical protein [Nostocaceae cyanobacterium]
MINFVDEETVEAAIAHNEQLTSECHQLVDAVANQKYSRKLLTLVKSLLESCLDYKANRIHQPAIRQ